MDQVSRHARRRTFLSLHSLQCLSEQDLPHNQDYLQVHTFEKDRFLSQGIVLHSHDGLGDAHWNCNDWNEPYVTTKRT